MSEKNIDNKNIRNNINIDTDICIDKKIRFDSEYDVIVIGAGHAGCEAGLISARMGMKTALFCTDINSVAMMPCNPSIGGTGKGHLVKEIDALGGEMGINADKTFIQSKMLNTSKGPAVHSLRMQSDKEKYHDEMLKTITTQKNLDLIVEEITEVLYREENHKRIAQGVLTDNKLSYKSKTVIICTGTFLEGKIFIGDDVKNLGPSEMKPSNALGENLKKIGFPIRRFKTGTPARMKKDSLNYNLMNIQTGDEKISLFSFMNENKNVDFEQVPCWLSYTNEKTHQIIKDNIHKSAMYSGNIEGIGPRYCPSIEDKIVRFSDKPRHQLFVEPEGINSDLMYIQGMSSSLPIDIQKAFYSTIAGLEECEIVNPAYAIEYDCVDPTSLQPSLESKIIDGLFSAGQFNGSSGYEEAASQGLIAGINSVRKIKNENPLILKRNEAYIGVLIDDLVTKGTNEPYRIMTSRAEYRLLLRQGNADMRLTEIGYKYGSVSEERYKKFNLKKNKIEQEIRRLENKKTDIERVRKFLIKKECDDRVGIDSEDIIERRKNDIMKMNNPTFSEIIRRPIIKYEMLSDIDDEIEELEQNIRDEVEVSIKYAGYIKKQIGEVEKLNNLESKKLSTSLDYQTIRGLRLEARQKLSEIKPLTVGQASRISGVSPADINVLLIYLEKEMREKKKDNKN